MSQPMTAQSNDFGIGSMSRNIVHMAVPMTVAQLVNVLYNVVDRMYIGRLPDASTLALTGMGLCFPIVSVITAFANLFGTGGAPLCSIARGMKNEERAQKIMGLSFTMLVITGVLLTLFVRIFSRPILYLFGASDDTYLYAADYLNIYILGTVFVMISLGMNQFINSQGFAKTGMLTVMLGTVANIILDPIFIFVFDMGVKGAAYATVISQFLSAVWVLLFLTGKRAILKLKFSYMHFHLKTAGEICGLGLSGFIMSVTNASVQMVCNKMLGIYGGDLYVAVMTVLNSIRDIISMPVLGLTNGAQPVLGFNYGAKKYDRVKAGIRFMSISCIIYTFAIWALVVIFPALFIRLFNSEPDLLTSGVPALRLYFFGFFMMALQFAGQSAFVALGFSRHAVFFSLLRKVIIVIPLTIWLPSVAGLGVNGVFLAEPISNFLGGCACFFTMLTVVWKRLKTS